MNPSNCECDKSCGVGEYLDYKNCKWRKKLADKLTEERTENIDEVKIIATENKHTNKYSSCILTLCCFQYSLQSTLELVLIVFTTNTWIVIKNYF